MMGAGVPLDLGLETASAGFSSRLEELSQRVAERVRAGTPLADALEHETAIPPVHRAILVAGMRCGRSQDALEDLCQLTSALLDLRQSLYRGLLYPAILLCAAGLLFALVTNTYIPQMISLYRFLDSTVPPWLEFLNRFGVAALLIALLGTLGVMVIMFLGQGRKDRVIRGVSWIPRLTSDIQISRTSHLLSLLVGYGVPLPEALRLTAATAGARGLYEQLTELARAVERGEPLDHAVERQGTLPAFLRWLIVTGTQNSNLSTALREAAEYYRGRAQARANLVRVVVPALAMLFVGGSVTLLYAYSVFGPLKELWKILAAPF